MSLRILKDALKDLKINDLNKRTKKKKKINLKVNRVLKCVGVEKAISERNREGSANSKQPE